MWQTCCFDRSTSTVCWNFYMMHCQVIRPPTLSRLVTNPTTSSQLGTSIPPEATMQILLVLSPFVLSFCFSIVYMTTSTSGQFNWLLSPACIYEHRDSMIYFSDPRGWIWFPYFWQVGPQTSKTM
jgi:hypothetical protein